MKSTVIFYVLVIGNEHLHSRIYFNNPSYWEYYNDIELLKALHIRASWEKAETVFDVAITSKNRVFSAINTYLIVIITLIAFRVVFWDYRKLIFYGCRLYYSLFSLNKLTFISIINFYWWACTYNIINSQRKTLYDFCFTQDFSLYNSTISVSS